MHSHINRLLTDFVDRFRQYAGPGWPLFFQDKAAVNANAAVSRVQDWREAVIKDFPVAAKQSACPVNSSALATMVRL